jgi:hypothetical protein
MHHHDVGKPRLEATKIKGSKGASLNREGGSKNFDVAELVQSFS